MQSENKKKLSIIIPTYNEKETIVDLLITLIPYLKNNLVPFEILVIDDSSDDGTIQLVKSFSKKNKTIKMFIRTKEKGMGSAIFFGFQQASGDILIPLMADGSENLQDILLLYTTMCEKDYDVLFTNRFISKTTTLDYPFIKFLCNRTLNSLAAFFYKTPYTDLTNAFKAYNKRMVPKLHITTSGFETLLELPLLCLIIGGTFGEIPVSWYQRKKGHSKLHLLAAGRQYFWVMMKYLPRRYKRVYTYGRNK